MNRHAPARQPVLDRVIYEQPLNERIRSFLRLEFLFNQADYSLRGASVWNSRQTMSIIIEIQSLLGRNDMKTEVLKELERNTASLAKLEQNPDIDRQRLNDILDELDMLIDRLYANSQPIGVELKQNEFINGIKQRLAMPGGTCGFDLPGYHHWLQKPGEARIRELKLWLGSFDLLRDAITLILGLIRESAVPKREMAEAGFFQRSMDSSAPCQMIRVGLPAEADYFPEVSGGKHRYTIRFMRLQDYESKPKQVDANIPFELACCII